MKSHKTCIALSVNPQCAPNPLSSPTGAVRVKAKRVVLRVLTGRLLSYSKKLKLAEMATRCHSLSFVVTHCHLLYHSLSLVASLFVIRCHSLSLVVPLVVTCCRSMSLVVT